jgi:hypothetical protein
MARAGLALFAVLLSLSAARACSVPVFRYALERWSPSPYELVIFHRGPLGPADQDRVRGIRESDRPANLKVTMADVDGSMDASLRRVWDRDAMHGPLPRACLRYPESGPDTPSLWAGSLSEAPVPNWLDSPARRSLFERLSVGHAGVILLLLSGDAAADDGARAMLRRELPGIARGIELPARTGDGPQLLCELPLRIEFPVVEVRRTADEQSLVRMLLASEDGLADAHGPIAFLVFGRGRALCSLHGQDLEKPDELRRALEYLCRACSCQVKELNPGLDLLISGNWDRIFEAERGPAPREVSASMPVAEPRSASGAGPPPAELRSAPPAGYEAAESYRGSGSRSGRAPWLPYAAGAAALVLVAASRAVRVRRVSGRM